MRRFREIQIESIVEPAQRLTSFKSFWPHYVQAHRRRDTQLLHLFGTIGAAAFVVVCFDGGFWHLIPASLLIGYGPAWFAHFFLEHNRPATLDYPLYSLIADWVMIFYILTGKMSEQVERHCRLASSPKGMINEKK